MPPSLPAQVSLNQHLFAVAKVPDDLRHLMLDIARAAKYIHYAIRTTKAGLAGTQNTFGEEQLKLDVLSDDIIRQHLMESRLVSSFASEENDSVIELQKKAPYCVVFDPLDGSSLVDVNFAIGTIVGIYPGSTMIGRTPGEQVAALYVLYGPRTVLIYAAGDGVHEFLLNEVGEFVLLREYLGIADKAKNYSPGNLNAANDNPGYKKLMGEWMKDGLTLRYSGCMAADAHHIVSKGQGVFVNVGGGKYPDGKLRLVFECGPFAFIAEKAGGAASDGDKDILKKKIDSIDQRTPIIIGSKDEVKRSCKILSSRN